MQDGAASEEHWNDPCDGTFTPIRYGSVSKYTFTAGLNYALTGQMGIFGRFNTGFLFPNFDAVPPRNGATAAPIQTIKQYEAGYKVASRRFDAYATLFGNTFEGLPFQQFGLAGCPAQGCTAIAGARAYGVEVETELRPAAGLRFGLTGTYTHAEFTDYNDNLGNNFTGNQTLRQPRWTGRLSAAYTLRRPSGSFTPYATWTYVGDRFGDTANLQTLPSYNKLDAGISLDIGRRINLHVVGDNLTDVIGLTEGDPRAAQNVFGNLALARPIQGRSVQASVAYKF